MKREFVQTDSRKVAKNKCPWAAKITKVDNGYMCFESFAEWETWHGQK